MWLYRISGEANNQIVLYENQPDRKHTHPVEFLKDFSGYIHADYSDGYHKLPENITVVA
jgi:transposase